jgi:hypothetical protein
MQPGVGRDDRAELDVRGQVSPFDLAVIADGAASRLPAQVGLAVASTAYAWGALWAMFDVEHWPEETWLAQRYRSTRNMFGLMPTAARRAVCLRPESPGRAPADVPQHCSAGQRGETEASLCLAGVKEGLTGRSVASGRGVRRRPNQSAGKCWATLDLSWSAKLYKSSIWSIAKRSSVLSELKIPTANFSVLLNRSRQTGFLLLSSSRIAQ